MVKVISLLLSSVSLLVYYQYTTIAEELHFIPSEPDSEVFIQQAWTAFKTQHGKDYAGVDEEHRRKQIFYDSLKTISSHNYLYETGRSSYKMGINQFSDMEFSEFVHMLGYVESNASYTGDEEAFSSTRVEDIPSSIDWRNYGYVTGVKNQGHCGSCWAFSATGSLEGQTKRKTSRLVSISEQNLVDCSTAQGNHGCNGGWMNQAFEYIKINGGIDTEVCYPYEGKNGICRYSAYCRGATVLGYTSLQRGSEEVLKKGIAVVGPIAVAINVLSSFQHYRSGIYNDSSCDDKKLNHAVLAVGYGAIGRQAYYLVKNSWGVGWGEGGYVRMARDQNNMCGIASAASFPVV